MTEKNLKHKNILPALWLFIIFQYFCDQIKKDSQLKSCKMKAKCKLTTVILSALSLVPLLFTACNDQDEFEDIYFGLDVEDNTPLTRSTSEQYEGGSNNTTWADVPKKENECMLYAMIKMATDNRTTMGIKYTYQDKNGEEKTRTRNIGEGYSAASAYNYAFSVATKYK